MNTAEMVNRTAAKIMDAVAVLSLTDTEFEAARQSERVARADLQLLSALNAWEANTTAGFEDRLRAEVTGRANALVEAWNVALSDLRARAAA